jgi:alpha-glucosidase
MRLHRSFAATIYIIFIFLSCHASSITWAESSSSAAELSLLALRATSQQSPNGFEVNSGNLNIKVSALRDDVLRVTLYRGGASPEDASWGVLPEARKSLVPVTFDSTGDHFGFRTKALIVEVDKSTLQLTIRDLYGNILQQDARPIRFDGDAFRIYKTMPLNEHYFGLGDKTGPLDRRNEAFTLWNTDAYRFQEFTDPLYKSIPYFMTFRAGRAVGLLLDNTWRTSFDFGKESPEVYSFGAVAGPVNYYLFYGPTPKQVVKTYAWLTGTPPLPPLWSLGFQQSRYSYMSQERVLEVAHRFRADSIPVDAIYLDIDFQDKNRPFTVNRAAFPDLPGLVAFRMTAELPATTL